MNDDKVRKLIAEVEPILRYTKEWINIPRDGADIYHKTILALISLEEIKKDIGYKEDKPDKKNKLKNHKLFK